MGMSSGPRLKAIQNGPRNLVTAVDVSNPKCFTGDTATKDKDGYIWFVGRSDDIITSSGYRISPFEVESTLLEHPNIVEAAVVAKPDKERGEIVAAYIVLGKNYNGNRKLKLEIQEFVKNNTAPYKYPREIISIAHFNNQKDINHLLGILN